MNVTFVALGWEQLGISLLSAIAKREGHNVSLAFSSALFNDRYNLSIPSIAPFFDDRKDVIDTIKQNPPDVLAFSALTGTYQWMLGIAREAKQLYPDVKIIFGGVHVSAVPERVLANDCVDAVIVGEGDIAFPQYLKAIEENALNKPIPNTRFKLMDGTVIRGPQTGFIQDLNSLPIFDKFIWEDYIPIGDWYLTMASRGCPYRCTFCFNNFFAQLPEQKKGKYVRQRSVEHMMYELRMAKKRYKLKFLEFEDDVFTVDKSWVKAFLYQYKKEINVPFQCLTHPRYLDDDVARWLADAGCQYIQMGVQTMDDEYKFETIKRYEKKEHVYTAMELMAKYKIKAKVDHMFGLPDEPMQAQEEARKLYATHQPYRIQTFWTNFLPGTEMVHQALEKGLITLEEVERLNDGLEFDFYRNSNKIEDPQKLRTYKSYEILFKLIPILPKSLLPKINPKIFSYIPPSISSFFTFFIDALAGLITRNPDHFVYAKYYLFQMYVSLSKRFTKKRIPATKIFDKDLFDLTPPKASKITNLEQKTSTLT